LLVTGYWSLLFYELPIAYCPLPIDDVCRLIATFANQLRLLWK